MKNSRMDRGLAERLNALNEQNDRLKAVEAQYLALEANRKSLLGKLISQQPGKSFAEREMQAYASAEWIDFAKGLADVEADYEFEKRRYDILDKAYLADHLSAKLDGETIKRQGGAA